MPALRYLLRFVDVDSTIEDCGFQKKVFKLISNESLLNRFVLQTGAAFKLSAKNREGCELPYPYEIVV